MTRTTKITATTTTTMNWMEALFLWAAISTGMNMIMSWHLWAASATIDLDRAILEGLAAILDDIMAWEGMEEIRDLEEVLMGMEVTRTGIRRICLGIPPVMLRPGRVVFAEIWDRSYDD